MRKVVDQKHVEEGIETQVGDPVVEFTTTHLQKVLEWQSILKFFDEDLLCAEFGKRSWEGDGASSTRKVLLEANEVVSLVAEVKLRKHHVGKDVDFFWEREPLCTRMALMTLAKNRMILISLPMVFSTRGWRILMATLLVGIWGGATFLHRTVRVFSKASVWFPP